MADQRMDISSTISDFMSPGTTDLLSSPLGTSSVDCNRKRKGSSTDYQLDDFSFEESMDTDKDDPHGRLDYSEHQGRIKNARWGRASATSGNIWSLFWATQQVLQNPQWLTARPGRLTVRLKSGAGIK